MTGKPLGRPRPDETKKRDKMIYDLLKERGPLTRNALADGLGVPRTLVYLALVRLREAGRVRMCLRADSTTVWSAETGSPCP